MNEYDAAMLYRLGMILAGSGIGSGVLVGIGPASVCLGLAALCGGIAYVVASRCR